MDGNWFEFIAIQGLQARKAFYIIMVPLKVVPKFFKFDDDSLPPSMRAQRTLNKTRIPQISRYIIDNPDEYILSSLCACVDGEVVFEPNDLSSNLGKLKISMDATVLINDGQHRRAAIEEALKHRPHLGNETISVVVYADQGLKRSQQMFADLNMHAVKPAQSIKLLFNHRDEQSNITKAVIENIELFREFTDFEKSSLSNRTTNLFTFSSLHQATKQLLSDFPQEATHEEQVLIATKFWSCVIEYIPGWLNLLEGKITAAELRNNYIHAHGIAVQALGKLGNILLTQYPDNWESKLNKLIYIDWSRNNLKVWYGRALVAGKINKSRNNLILVTNHLQKTLGISLSPEAQRVENLLFNSLNASQEDTLTKETV
ncbi:DNA sulfur modification protein DndB [Acinetobacter baumannii]|uniref:DNA sulfur modification protein DndB n=1 Tax=Acinetobacter baumannii TaxID=470 RepID=UPI0014637CC6|nr:DNA sulfur modification protein DndB [Acinetobacter baumannii]MCG5961082.1 DNA sulfur modification protein DndB [Acinetobacter baumannii]QJP36183.1 DNA sulfur modification protein DndB [Acinetobacter baumannii]